MIVISRIIGSCIVLVWGARSIFHWGSCHQSMDNGCIDSKLHCTSIKHAEQRRCTSLSVKTQCGEDLLFVCSVRLCARSEQGAVCGSVEGAVLTCRRGFLFS